MRVILAGFILAMSVLGRTAAAIVVTSVATDAQLGGAEGITTDGVNLYLAGVVDSTTGGVFSVPIGGGSVTQLYTYTGVGINPGGITSLGSDLFWVDAQSGPVTDTQIFRAPVNGSGPVTPIYTGSTVGQPIVDGSGLASDGAKLYSADFVQGRVHSLNPDGSGIMQLGPNRYGGFFDREHANHIAVDGGIAYIADSGRDGFPDTPPRVQSIPTAGGSFSTLFAGSLPGFSPDGIAVDSGTIFLTNSTEILHMPTSGGIPSLLVSDPGFVSLANLTFFENALYVQDPGANTVWKVDLVPEPTALSLVFGMLAVGVFRRWTARCAA